MKYKQIIFLISITILSFNKIFSNIITNRANFDIITGDVNLSNKSYQKNLTVYGALNFSNLIVENQLTVYGKLSGQDLKTKAIIVNGLIEANNITILDHATFNGEAILENSILNNCELNIKTSSNEASTFKNTIINKNLIITVTNQNPNFTINPDNKNKSKIIKCIGNTIIKGDVICTNCATNNIDLEVHIYMII